MSTAREQHSATLLASGKVLLAGGIAVDSPLLSSEIYDPSLETFAPAGNLITARFNQSAALLQSDKVLIVGGAEDTGANPTPLSSAEIYDPGDGLVPELRNWTLPLL